MGEIPTQCTFLTNEKMSHLFSDASVQALGAVPLTELSCLNQEEVLEQQQQERDDSSFHRLCMFCSEEFTGNR